MDNNQTPDQSQTQIIDEQHEDQQVHLDQSIQNEQNDLQKSETVQDNNDIPNVFVDNQTSVLTLLLNQPKPSEHDQLEQISEHQEHISQEQEQNQQNQKSSTNFDHQTQQIEKARPNSGHQISIEKSKNSPVKHHHSCGSIDPPIKKITQRKSLRSLSQSKELPNLEILPPNPEQDQNQEDDIQKTPEIQEVRQSISIPQESVKRNSDSRLRTDSQMKLLQASISSKDQMIMQLQEDMKFLKESLISQQNDSETKMENVQKEHKIQIEELLSRIAKLEKALKEKENDLEQYRNGNQTLHLQDVSAISMNQNLKSNQNENKKDLTIFDVLNEKHSTADLSDLGNNFWLISAERKMQKHNPLYKDYTPKVVEEVPKKSLNFPTKKYDKSHWYKFIEVKKRPHYQLPKLPESFQHNLSPEQKLQTQQPVPFSQKLLAKNQIEKSQIQQYKLEAKNPLYSSQPQLFQGNKAYPSQFDPDDFIAEQEIERMFQRHQSKQLNWEAQPQSNVMIEQHTNSNVVQEHKERYPILTQKQSYEKQYSHKKELQQQLNDSQNNTKLYRNK